VGVGQIVATRFRSAQVLAASKARSHNPSNFRTLCALWGWYHRVFQIGYQVVMRVSLDLQLGI